MIYNFKTLPYDLIAALPTEKRRRGNQGTSSRRTYVHAVCAFDIETTRLDADHSIMYVWQFQIEEWTVCGRSWTEFRKLIKRLKACRPEGERYVVHVHNLAFEYQFLRGVFPIKAEDVFLTDARKPLRLDIDCLEFRCSYRHSNLSLDLYLKKMGVEHKKTSMDYSVMRYPWTPLTDAEWEYCVNDVRGLVEALKKDMELDNDNLYSFPLTSTGYCRRLAKAALRHTPAGYIKNQLPDMDVYQMLRVAFRGGNTHASRYYAGKIIHGVQSYDRSSSYPEVMINAKYPINQFCMTDPYPDTDYVFDLITKREKAVVMTVRLWGVHLKDPFWGFPYLAIDKCTVKNPRDMIATGLCYDNGRILSADYLETTCTDVDLRIILDEYDFDDIEFERAAFARYGELPPAFKNLIRHFYKQKTLLKGATGDDAIYGMKMKELLNSLYGMTAQAVIRHQYSLISGEYVDDCRHCPYGPEACCRKNTCPVPKNTPEKQMEDYHRKGWLPYQWGVWTTAHARAELEKGLRIAGDGAIYCDTDSVKYIGSADWTQYNKEKIDLAAVNGGWADDKNGKRHYLGVYECETPEPLPEFATLGAKKYCYRTPDGKLKATISGVNKALGGQELDRAGGLKAFLTPGFTFHEAGGRELRYLDQEDTPVVIDGHRVRRRPAVTISDSTYTLGITDDYDRLLKNLEIWLDFLREKFPENI